MSEHGPSWAPRFLRRARRRGALSAGAAALLVFACVPASDAEIDWYGSHARALRVARDENRPMMVEFTADWCVPCRELEARTYPHPRVRAEAARFVSVRIDATERSDEVDELMQRYRVYGLPTVVFIDSKGELLDEPRVTGFVEPERFAALLGQVR